jgi:Flp pilus assembly protein TadD
MGDRAAAIRSLERALELAPQDATAPAMLGSVYAADGQTDKAIAAYRASLKLAPGNLFASNNLAYLLAENGRDLDEALALAQNAVQRGGGDPMYADTLGFVYMKRGQVDAALQAFQSAVTRAPDVATYRLNLALAFERKGDREAAKKELETGLTKQVSEQERTEMERLLSRL